MSDNNLRVLLENRKALPRDPAALDADQVDLLKDLQCNILSSHDCDKAFYYFLSFKPDAKARDGEPDTYLATKYLLGMLAHGPFGRAMILEALTNADLEVWMPPGLKIVLQALRATGLGRTKSETYLQLQQLRVPSEYDVYLERGASQQARAKKRDDGPPRTAVNVLLSRSGYGKLGMEPPGGEAFRAGMKQRRELLTDPPLETWDEGYARNKKGDAVQIDALIVIAWDSSSGGGESFKQSLVAFDQILNAHAVVLAGEKGSLRYSPAPRRAVDKKNYTIEPFGFRDSISQPAFYAFQMPKTEAEGQNWDPFAPLSLALCPDPHGRSDHACGTFFVFRKLEQHVARFYDQTNDLAERLKLNSVELRAGIVGRNLDGTPLGVAQPFTNDFDFSEDANGARCPFTSHMRKANPRADVHPSYQPKRHRIVRRGTSYGPKVDRNPDGSPKDEWLANRRGAKGEPVGTLFLCAQSEIETQFEHIQANWINTPNHPPGRRSGIDLLAGQVPLDQQTRDVDLGGPKRAAYTSVVALRGGEYFFAPSLSFLRGLLNDLLMI